MAQWFGQRTTHLVIVGLVSYPVAIHIVLNASIEERCAVGIEIFQHEKSRALAIAFGFGIPTINVLQFGQEENGFQMARRSIRKTEGSMWLHDEGWAQSVTAANGLTVVIVGNAFGRQRLALASSGCRLEKGFA
jgi:hypothetical protein